MTLATETLNLWRNNAEITAGETAEDDPEHIAAKAIFVLTAELLANREAQPVADGENCWSCGNFFTYAQHSECDGYCPHCNAPVDLDEEEIGDEA